MGQPYIIIQAFSYSIMGAYWSATQESNFYKEEKEDLEKKRRKSNGDADYFREVDTNNSSY